MPASTPEASRSAEQPAAGGAGLRFGHPLVAEGAVEWVLKRNCSITPRQMLAAYAGICGLSLGVAALFWLHGARLVMPFAWIEVAALGAAFWAYARHAGDRERIALRGGRLTVEHTHGGRVERMDFIPGWVRVEPERGDRSLIELSSRGLSFAVGRYVRPELRPMLADELRSVLRGCQSAMQHETV